MSDLGEERAYRPRTTRNREGNFLKKKREGLLNSKTLRNRGAVFRGEITPALRRKNEAKKGSKATDSIWGRGSGSIFGGNRKKR